MISAGMSGTQLGEKSTFNFAWILLIIISVAFMILGNFMPTIKQNKMLGIKLPWTLKNENCWKTTHRLCGNISVYGGIIVLAALLVMAFVGASEIIGLIITLTFVIGTFSVCIAAAYKHRND